MKYRFIISIIKISLICPYVLAAEVKEEKSEQVQSLDDQEIINVENLYKNNPKSVVKPQKLTPNETVSPQEQKAQLEIKKNMDVQKGKVKGLTDLNKLAPFTDISVIQKKFLPKTERFQLYSAGGLMTNSPWFNNLGIKISLSYNFIESLGIETSATILSGSEAQSAKEIRSNNSLEPDKFIFTKNNLMVDLVWSPIYGKITNVDSVIIPFDMYFSFGGGFSGTNGQEKTAPTIHIGTGQVFALSKAMAFRWDYSWSMYQATPVEDVASTNAPAKSNYNDLILTAGISFFFPEANYR